ncbi:MAG: GOLPH3/VPS74 family protein [Jatrophihabitans sp.]|uniref:GOLPH3/VPS74 family protein n=1 Tax=Jatrophihabitans sp. TaxID=1932789 RepID=UPI003F809376
MQLLDLLPLRVLVLAARPETGRLPAGAHIRELTLAAALGELWLAGAVLDDRGRVVRGAGSPPDWPALAQLLADIERRPGRRWQSWIRRTRGFERPTMDALLAGGLAADVPQRFLGIPFTRFTVDPGARAPLAAEVDGWLRSSVPVPEIPQRTALTIALADAARLATVLPRPERRAHAARLRQLADHYEPLPRALRRAIASNSGGEGVSVSAG